MGSGFKDYRPSPECGNTRPGRGAEALCTGRIAVRTMLANQPRKQAPDSKLSQGQNQVYVPASHGLSAMACFAAMRPENKHSPMLPPELYPHPQKEPSSPVPYNRAMGFLSGSTI